MLNQESRYSQKEIRTALAKECPEAEEKVRDLVVLFREIFGSDEYHITDSLKPDEVFKQIYFLNKDIETLNNNGYKNGIPYLDIGPPYREYESLRDAANANAAKRKNEMEIRAVWGPFALERNVLGFE